MAHSRCFLLPVLACSTLLLMGGWNHQATPSAPPSPPAGVEPIDLSGTPGGTEILDAAAAAFAPERVPWVQMTLWQRVQCEDFTYEAEGRYLCAPGQRLRLDLKVLVGQTQGELQMISSGTALRSTCRLDNGIPATITAVDFSRQADQSGVAPEVHAPSNLVQEAERILQEHGCPGVAPLLRTVRARLQEPRWKMGRWKEQDVILVMGRWSPESDAPPGIRATLPPTTQLRACRVYLDARTLWPHRIEWWGSQTPHQRTELLMQVEYREPVLNQPLPSDRCAREFALSQAAPEAAGSSAGTNPAARYR